MGLRTGLCSGLSTKSGIGVVSRNRRKFRHPISWPRQRPARRVLAVRVTVPLTQAAKARQRANFAGSRGRLNRKPPVASPLPCGLPWLPSGGVALPGGEVGMFGGLAGIGFAVLLRLVAFEQQPCGGVFDAVAP
jgi:hypothetical protein